MRNGLAFRLQFPGSRSHGSESSTPGNGEDFAGFRSVNFLFRNVVGDAINLRSSNPDHRFVVVRVVTDVA